MLIGLALALVLLTKRFACCATGEFVELQLILKLESPSTNYWRH